MSTDTEHVEEGTETSVLETWEDWYHVPVVGVVMLFMIWVRTQAYDAFTLEDGAPALDGVDSWYHWRTIRWTAENYPHTMPYEVWTGFPTGNYVGQFGTLFDQLIVTAAMIVGLGDPSTSTLYTVSLLAVPVMAALVAIPVFYIGRRLGGTIGGLVAVVVLALAPGQFLTRTTVGQLQHHVAEALFMAIAVLAMMVAVRAAEREKPIYELVVDADWDALRAPTVYSALAGLALTLYVWVWPPAVVLIGIFGVFFAVQLCLDHVRGVSPDHLAFVGAVSLGVTAITTAVLIEEPGISVTGFSYLQPLTAALVAVGCLFMAWLARQWNARDVDPRYYPAAIAGLVVAAFGVMWLVLPDLYGTLVGNLTSRLLPIDPGTGSLTIQEAQPPADFTAHVFGEFGTAFYTMLAGLALLVVRPYFDRDYRAEYTLVLIWSLFLISMAATQVRFAYYLVLAVAVVNAVFVADVVRFFDLDVRGGVQSLKQIETYQVIVLLMVVLLLFAPLLPPVAADGTTAMDRAEGVSPHSDAGTWEGSNEWLQENTPEPGDYGGADRADELEFYGSYDYPEDGDYDYPEGAYGVMSWWDYGHLITTQAERIPHANPFQSGATSAAAFFTAESEERSELILDAISADESPSDATDEQLEAMAENATDEEMRYVMIDHSMASGKFGAITQWTGPDYDHYVTPDDLQTGEPIDEDVVDDLPYYETTLSRLYLDDASGMEQYRLVHESADAGTAVFATYAQVFTEEMAEQAGHLGYEEGEVLYITDEGTIAPPGEGQPVITVAQRHSQQEIGQIEENPSYELLDVRSAAAVKTFERVEGATITGSVDDVADGATVTVALELETETERPVQYVQEAEVADGSFEVTVPYATDDGLGVEDGYTNSSVAAVDDYTVIVEDADGADGEPVYYQGETAVSETAVVDGDSVSVDLEEVAEEDLEEPGDDGTGAADDETDANETDDETSGALAPVALEPAG